MEPEATQQQGTPERHCAFLCKDASCNHPQGVQEEDCANPKVAHEELRSWRAANAAKADNACSIWMCRT